MLGELEMLHAPVDATCCIRSGSPAPDTRIAADSAGVFFPAVARDTRVKKGQVVGHTTDFLGRPTGDIRAPIDGLVTFIRGVPSMWPRATLVNVAPVLSAPGPGRWKSRKLESS